MRYLKTLLVALLAIVTTSAFADNGFVGSEATDGGTYYLYNVGAKQFLVAGNSWGTRASFGEHATMDVKLGSLGGGKYSIYTGISNGGTSYYLSLSGGSPWCDQLYTNGQWTFVDAGIPGAHAFYMYHPDAAQYLAYDGSSVAAMTTTTDQNALWLLLTKQELIDELQKADADNGVDATFLISAPNFGRNDLRNSSWSGAPALGGANDNFCAEKFNTSYDVYQDVTDAPAGAYTVNVQGFYRMSGAWNASAAATARERGSEEINAELYVNNDTKKLYSILDFAGQNGTVGYETSYGHVPNSMSDASSYFTKGFYDQSLDFNLSGDATTNAGAAASALRIGVRSTTQQHDRDWTIFDNFRLTFYGPGENAGAKSLYDEIEDFMKVPAALIELQNLIDQCKGDLADLDENDAAGLQEAIDAAQAVHDSSIDLEEIQQAIADLTAARAAYNALGVARDLAVDVLNQVPYVLFPADFKWAAEKDEKLNDVEKMDVDRNFKVYKNNAGKYQLASRIAVAALVRLYEFSIADEKAKKAIVDRLAELGVENYEEALAEALTKYARLVVETHGVGAALGEQGDKNYSRMYAALEQAGVDDVDAFVDVLLSGASDGATVYEAASIGGEVSGNSWTSKDGLVTITRESGDDIVSFDPSYPYYWTVKNGEDWKVKVNEEDVTLSALAFNGLAVFLHVDDEDAGSILTYNYRWAWDYSVSGKTEATVHIDYVYYPQDDPDLFFEVVLQDNRNPWVAAGAEKTTSDIYEMLHDYADGYWGFDANFTAHIVDPDLTEGGDAWESTWGGILSSESLTDSEGSTEYPYFDANTWNESGTMEVDAHQTIQLPAGRYMLTAAGRASANNSTKETAVRADGAAWTWNDGTNIDGYVWEGAFTEAGAEDPQNYFQLYATTYEGKTTSQSFLELVGNTGGIFENGWNDASVFFTMPSTGDVTIGVRAATNVKERWASATRFRLTRLGDATLYLDENETFTTELNWDAVASEMGTWAPVDFVLHKQMEADKWYSISLPGDISPEQIFREFGEGTQLAMPVGVDDWSDDGTEKYITFLAYNPSRWYLMEDVFGNGSMGMMANVPYLIKPAQVKKSNLYNFYGITNTETKSFFKDGKWSYGALSLTMGDGWFETGDDGDVRIYPNYIYNASFPDNYTIEFNDTLKAFSSVFVADDAEVVASILVSITDDGQYDWSGQWDILSQQLNDAIALGQQKVSWYPGLPTALVNEMTSTAWRNAQTMGDYITYLKNVRAAIAEAPEAYKAAKAYYALYAKAEELLASDHVEKEAGADNAFQRLLNAFTTLYNRQTTAEGIEDLTARLQTAIDDYLAKIKLGGIQEGKNYLRNVATGKYLGAANSWGTQASLIDRPEFVTLAQIADGVYTIETQVNNGGEQYYLGTNGFMDANPAMQVTMDPAGEYYTLTTAELGVLGYDGSSTVLGTNLDAADENALWEVISEKDMVASLDEASEENPVEATFLFNDTNFGRNNRFKDAWEGDEFAVGGANENFNAEKWGGNSQTFDVHQTANVPNGVYHITANGYYRYNNTETNTNDVAIAAHADGTEVINSFVYANDVVVPLKSIADDAASAALASLPFSQSDASAAFGQGLYLNDVLVEVKDGQLTLGVKKTFHPGCDWTVWDNFVVTFYGDADIEAVRAALNAAGSGEATGISDVNAANGKTEIYTINGVRVNSITQKGLYIVNGRKVLVK